jgi:hypothetical protein
MRVVLEKEIETVRVLQSSGRLFFLGEIGYNLNVSVKYRAPTIRIEKLIQFFQHIRKDCIFYGEK